MDKATLRTLAQQAVAQATIKRIPSGRRTYTERQMYLRTEATDKEVQDAVLAGEEGADVAWLRRGQGILADVEQEAKRISQEAFEQNLARIGVA